jgi:hypothetical protein
MKKYIGYRLPYKSPPEKKWCESKQWIQARVWHNMIMQEETCGYYLDVVQDDLKEKDSSYNNH